MIFMKFEDILGSGCVSMYKKNLAKKFDTKGLFWPKKLKICRFLPFFTYKIYLGGDFGSLTCIALILYVFYALYIHF